MKGHDSDGGNHGKDGQTVCCPSLDRTEGCERSLPSVVEYSIDYGIKIIKAEMSRQRILSPQNVRVIVSEAGTAH
jgi:hypothetical protein